MSDEEIRRQLMGYSRQFEPAAVPPADVIQSRLRRRRIKLAAVTGSAAAMLAVSAVAAAAVIGPAANPTGPHRAAVSPLGWLPAGRELPAHAGPQAAPYVVTLGLGRTRGRIAAVHDWRTGKFLGQLRPPDGRCFWQIMGASDDRTFLISVQGCYLFIRTWFYELRLTRSGHPEPLIPIRLPKFLNYSWNFALSPDGTHLAYVSMPVSVPRTRRPNKSTITIYDLMTGKRRSWYLSGLAAVGGWAGDRDLVISAEWNGRSPAPFKAGYRMLNTNAPGHRLLAARLIPAYDGGDPLPAASGVMYSTLSPIIDGSVWTEIARFSARTGRPEVIFRPSRLLGHEYSWCDPLWTDGSGAHALAVCGNPGHDLRMDGDRMRSINLHFPVQFMQPSMNNYYFAF
jgi:hypothetical protein